MTRFRNGFIFVGPADHDLIDDNTTEDFRRRVRLRDIDTSSDFDDTTD